MACSILVIRALVEVLERSGVAREEFLRASGFDVKRLADPNGRIEIEELDVLQELALDMSKNDALGIRMGEMASATTYNLAAHLVAHATTLRDGIEALLQFHRLLTDRQVWELREDGRTATIACDIQPGPVRCRRFRAEMTMTGFYRMLVHFERLARPECVAFDYVAPEYRTEYRRIFGGAERFEQPFIGITFPRHLLGAVQLHRDPEFHNALRNHAERRVSQFNDQTTYRERVREYVLVSAPAARRNMAAVARGLGMSARSLRRRLHEEGVSYVDVIEEALATVAKRMILDERHSIQATAYAMGYSVPAAFHRAFKRWTGSTPAAYRANRDRAAPVGEMIGHA